MLLEFEYDEIIAQGYNATLVHEVEEGKALLFFVPEGKDAVHQTVAEVPMGIWTGLNFGPQSELAPDKNVQYVATYYLPGERIWFVWKSDNLHRHAVSIDDGARYDLESPYRLFYATDTKKLYMNIAEMWQFIASPDITLLEGYQELVDKINELETGLPPEILERIDSIQMDYNTLIEVVNNLTSRIEALEESSHYPGTPIQFAEPTLVDYVYYAKTGQSEHSVSIEAREGNRLIAAVVTREELLQYSPDWELLGTGASLYDYTDKFTQYIHIFHKEASGNDILEYYQTLASRSYACIMEFEHCGVPALHHLESPIASTNTGLRVTKRTLDTVLWIGHSIYWPSESSATEPWRSSPQLPTLPAPGTEQPRLGVFIDTGDMQEYELNTALMTSEEFSIIGVRLPKGIVRV